MKKLEGAMVEMKGFETAQTESGKTVKIRKRSPIKLNYDHDSLLLVA